MSHFAEAAKLHRNNVYDLIESNGFAYLRGNITGHRPRTDVELLFRQESFFHYLTGVEEPDCHLILDLNSRLSYLVIPVYSSDHALWSGNPMSTNEFKTKYDVDFCITTKELPRLFKDLDILHVLDDDAINIDIFDNVLNSTKIMDLYLKPAIIQSRMKKTSYEIELLKKAAKISGNAHIKLMKQVKQMKNERQCQALFEYECFRNDAPTQAYTPIVAAGKNASVLHYIENNLDFPDLKDSLLLVDAGCEYFCYASDITRTFPISGKFVGNFKIIYEIVLETQMKVLDSLKVGVEWEDMHRLATRVILDGLIKANIVKGNYDDLMMNHIPALFFPHGLGHLLGIDVHDVGGYPAGVPRIDEPGIKYLRFRGKLEAGMVVTVEPGLYFVDAILEPAINDPKISQFLNLDVLKEFRKVGGVRIEDDVLILEDGIDNLTGWIPKSVKDIECLMAEAV